jgi:1-aminocyclopropane-1-carboxylate deaminase/D-cysteine desulfhydrase-like pyridoxal-dependent ACC family enzyme
MTSGAEELTEQVEAGLPPPDVIYVALGSCGTVAGLLAGLRGARALAPEVVAVRVVSRLICNAWATRRLEGETLALTRRGGGRERLAPRVALRVEHGQYGRGYGHPTPAAAEAVTRAAEAGLGLETTYTGKAMAQLLADARSGRLDGKRVLFLHTYSSVDLSPRIASMGEPPPAVARLLRR